MPSNSNDSPPAGAPGYAFKDGKLCIFREHEVMVIHGWPNPWAVRKACGSGEWVDFQPGFALVKPYRSRRRRKPGAEEAGQLTLDLEFREGLPGRPAPPGGLTTQEQRKRAFDRFRFSLPRPVAAALEQFRFGQWGLLSLISRHEEALDLVRSNPVLAYLVVLHVERRRLSHGRTQDILRMKQKDILGELRLPQSPAAVKILRKVYVQALTPEHADHLRQAIRSEPTRKALAHVPRLHSGVMDLVGKPGLFALCAPRLLLEVSGRKEELYRPLTASRLADILTMRRHMEEGRVVGSRFGSLRQLDDFHRQTLVAYHRHGEEEMLKLQRRQRERQMREERLRQQRELAARRRRREENQRQRNRAPAVRPPARRAAVPCPPPFPKPPIPGNAYIIPIASEFELIREGRLQSNCVGSYGRRVMEGRVYIYRVTWPERATLSLRREADGNWRRGELERSGNRRAGAATARVVDEWLAEYHVGA